MKLTFKQDSAEVKVVAGVRRIDLASAPMAKPELMENGWLRCEAVLTKTGVFPYRNADGTERRELRLPQHVFDKASMESFRNVPVCDDHPDVGWLDAQNTKSYSCGSAEMPIQDGDKMRAKLLVTDAALVSKIMNREKCQVSNGYFADLEMRSGSYDGQDFDAVQTNIRGNHVAIVDEARAGPEARIKLDGLDAVESSVVRIVQGATPEPSGEHMPKMRIDGVEFEAPEQTIQAIDKKLKKLDEKVEERDSKISELTAQVGKAEGERDAQKARADKLEGQLKVATDRKTIDAYVTQRLALVTKAQEILGDEFTADGKDARAIKTEVLAKLAPGVKLDGKSTEYVDACFDTACAREDSVDPLDRARMSIDHGQGDDETSRKDSKVLDARDEFMQRSRDLWKQPLPATAKRNGSK